MAQKKIDELIDSQNRAGWLMVTLKNVIGDTYRKRKRLMVASVPLELADGPTVDQVDIRLKYEGIIGKDDLKLLIWIYCEDVSYEMAAKRLGISLDACKKRIQRAKLRFKRALEEE